MKINVYSIIIAHIQTLCNFHTKKTSVCDIMVFYVFPLICGFLSLYFNISFDINSYGLSITFFGIFIALLLNIQVAIFSIFQRKWENPSDDQLKKLQLKKISERKQLLSELNSNISYLIVFSIFSLILSMIFYLFKIKFAFAASISIFNYVHFGLTILMIVKRSHALFQKEYDIE